MISITSDKQDVYLNNDKVITSNNLTTTLINDISNNASNALNLANKMSKFGPTGPTGIAGIAGVAGVAGTKLHGSDFGCNQWGTMATSSGYWTAIFTTSSIYNFIVGMSVIVHKNGVGTLYGTIYSYTENGNDKKWEIKFNFEDNGGSSSNINYCIDRMSSGTTIILSGEKGPTGEKGHTGAVGSAGANSTVTGYTGPAGANSTVTGYTGYTGYTGPVGPAGANSTVTGDTGATGPVGPVGPVGANSTVTGDTGATGPSIWSLTEDSTVYYNTGNVAIGKNTGFKLDDDGNRYSLDISGGIYAIGNSVGASWNNISDYRIKENPTLLNDNFIVDNLKPVSYINKLTSKENYGFLAHEVQEIYPILVEGEKDGETHQNLNYIGLTPILVKEIQKLKISVSNLQNEVNELKSKSNV